MVYWYMFKNKVDILNVFKITVDKMWTLWKYILKDSLFPTVPFKKQSIK